MPSSLFRQRRKKQETSSQEGDDVGAAKVAPSGGTSVCSSSSQRELLEGLQSLEGGSNLDVTTLLVKRKRRSSAQQPVNGGYPLNKENKVPTHLSEYTSLTQPPPHVPLNLGCDTPPSYEEESGLGQEVTIDALVDTLSKVLTRSLCQEKNMEHLWNPSSHNKIVAEENTNIPEPPNTENNDQHYSSQGQVMGSLQPPMQICLSAAGAPNPGGAYCDVVRPSAPYGVPLDGLRPGWAVPNQLFDPSILGFSRSASVPTRPNEGEQQPPSNKTLPKFIPMKSPFMTTGFEDQYTIGGYAITEWRRFFVYLATMDTGALIAYLNAQGAGYTLTEHKPPPPFNYHWPPSPPASPQEPSPTLRNTYIREPPQQQPYRSTALNNVPSSSVDPASRRRAQSRPWRRSDIPPPSEGRFKQIARAKATPEYLLYIQKVKKEDRDVQGGDPMTPRVEGTTWREFQQDVRAWKRSLHRKAEALQAECS
eukprot:Blabericola_migrator_1__1472@NODE_1389_length_4637_cov_329_046171_g929_i0_p2_GENE_NODE_1389_length_4637_cov_329_046171_g929_i0NODE_1389_length_4637_cov_329_046171_g929_i0_p2_ORF_typecomplete_len478_score73_15SLBP_RNA_bind/PF15247_6/7_5e03SLBP_RNA_bind/PF15247_6/7_1e03SLBP_RNA_bind/PF15247_6/1_3e11_NODE_1389_length_4637_cov_329_046171_g929_i028304263